MSWDDLGKLAAALVALVAVVQLFQGLRPRVARRAQIKTSLEILGMLPPTSTSRDRLLAHVDGRIEALIRDEDDLRRNWFNVASGCYLLVAPALFSAFFRTPWLVPVWALLAVLGGTLIWDGLPNAARDDRGFRVSKRQEESPAA